MPPQAGFSHLWWEQNNLSRRQDVSGVFSRNSKLLDFGSPFPNYFQVSWHTLFSHLYYNVLYYIFLIVLMPSIWYKLLGHIVELNVIQLRYKLCILTQVLVVNRLKLKQSIVVSQWRAFMSKLIQNYYRSYMTTIKCNNVWYSWYQDTILWESINSYYVGIDSVNCLIISSMCKIIQSYEALLHRSNNNFISDYEEQVNIMHLHR